MIKYKTHNNGELRLGDVGQNVKLSGWVQKSRRLGGLIFIDIRDRWGITQVVVEDNSAASEIANSLRSEFVISVEGKVIERKSKNKNMDTGEIEIIAKKIDILNKAELTPMIIADKTDALEDVRMTYRYLDIRRNPIKNNLILRHKITTAIREELNNNDFIEIETPTLAKSTPEGARDYLVPSRVNEKKFYALPQSPQIFKQLFMVGGIERYYQIARCYRDEDLRADRQPEFTQVDIEASFVNATDVQNITESIIVNVMKKAKGIDISVPFDRIKYKDAMNIYGSDKPDRRFKLHLQDFTTISKQSSFKIFNDAETVKAIVVPKILTRKEIDKLEYIAKEYGAKGLAWIKYENKTLNGPIVKFFSNLETEIISKLNIGDNSTVLFVADSWNTTCNALGQVRIAIAKSLDLIDKSIFDFNWVVDWPLYEYDEESKRYFSTHHPFTRPIKDCESNFDIDINKAKADAYDIVLNGYEIGGGSIRIHEKQMQERMFKTLGYNEDEINEKFGFFINAFKYGTPPHGGIALGLDRFAMILAGSDSIRDVIAFPKNSNAICQMTNAPSYVDDKAIEELHIKLK